MNRYRLSSQARNDLADIRQDIARDKSLAPDRQIQAFFRRFQILANNSDM